jgi:hypothetical protein
MEGCCVGRPSPIVGERKGEAGPKTRTNIAIASLDRSTTTTVCWIFFAKA